MGAQTESSSGQQTRQSRLARQTEEVDAALRVHVCVCVCGGGVTTGMSKFSSTIAGCIESVRTGVHGKAGL